MKISYNKLHDFIQLKESPEEIEKLLTGCGLEVESIESFETIKGGLLGVKVGHVLACEQHPNADRLKVTKVDVGTDSPLQIVCGASNVAIGQKVLVATVGTFLYPSNGSVIKIEKSKIRGEVSEGMICAEDELGLGTSHEGIMVLPTDTVIGKPASEIFDIGNDIIFEIGLTANRGDAASHIGVARDLSALLNRDMVTPSYFSIQNTDKPFSITIENNDDCPRYAGLYITNIQIKESPTWLKNFLLSIGLNPINNVVDITNYILHTLGQPIHAFDSKKIAGNKVIVRKAFEGQKFTTLDKIERTLTGSELMIYNADEPMAMAGVMGGLFSGVSESTTEIFVESAFFNAATIRKTAKSHGISTDSSFRFERGTDPESVVNALHKAAELIVEHANGIISSEVFDVYSQKINPININYSLEDMEKLIGQKIDKSEVLSILKRLEIDVIEDKGQILNIKIPAFKSDVTRQADVTEEILRIYGLNKINFPEQMLSSQSLSDENLFHSFKNEISEFLSSNGFCEMMTNSLVPHVSLLNPEDSVNLLNPLSSDLSSLRQSLLHTSLQSISYNKNRQIHDLMLYEFGKTYFKKGEKGFKEYKKLAIITSGNREPENYENKPREAGYFFIKSALENIFNVAGIKGYLFESKSNEFIDERGIYTFKQKEFAEFGFVNDKLLKQFNINSPVFYAEIDWDFLCQLYLKKKIIYQPVSKFPSVRRDLSLLLDEKITFGQVSELIKQTEKKILQEVILFDIYTGDKIESGKKSYAIGLKLLDSEKTLTDETIEKTISRIVQRLEKELQITLR